MSRLGEKTLMAHLTDRDSLEFLAREGLEVQVIPTESLRAVYQFAMDYYFEGGRQKAPSEGALRTEFGDLLDDEEIELGDPSDTIEWAVDDLRGTWVYAHIAGFNKRLSQAMAEAQINDRPQVVSTFASELVGVSLVLASRSSQVDIREAMDERLTAYDARQADQGSIYGIRFGLPEIDAYTGGIHPGELAILAGGPKAGKSLWMAMVALWEWMAGRSVALFTLENSVEMTLDRIACLANNISLARWLRGTCTEDERTMVRDWVRDAVKPSDSGLYVLQPDMGQRSMETMVRQAQLRGVDSLLIDQLTFVEFPDPRKPKNERIGEALHLLKSLISTGRDRLPCLLAHQISRDGMKAAAKTGFVEMHHMAESAEVERTGDWVFALYRSEAEKMAQQAKFQTLAARRAEPRSYQMTWNIDEGFVSVREQLTLAHA